MPNGNYLALTANAKEIENYYTSETDPDAPRANQKVVGDKIVEFTPEGEIVWDWNTFDHLDIWRFGYLLTEVYWHTRGPAYASKPLSEDIQSARCLGGRMCSNPRRSHLRA